MTTRNRILALTAVLSLAVVAVFWFFQRSQPAPASAEAPLAQTPTPERTDDGPELPAAHREASPAAENAQPSAVAPAATGLPPVAHEALTPPAEPTPVQAPVASATAPLAQAELAASARMYAAHASLRTPEVADPDSQGNKKVLGTMVAKLLTQPATPPPAPSR